MYSNLNEIILYFKYNTKVRNMYTFIAIILIAELIIATNLICLIMKADKKVVEFSDKVSVMRPELEKGLGYLKKSVAKFVLGVQNLCEFARKQREKYLISIVQNILIYLLLIILKGKSKRYFSAVQLVMSLRDCWTCK